METNYTGMIVAAVAAFFWSTVYYALLSKLLPSLKMSAKRPAAWKLGVELARNIGFTFIVAHVFTNLGVTHISQGLRHSFWLWLAFPVVLFAGTALWEDMPWKTAFSHMGDWLVKMILIASLLVALNK